MRRPSVAVVLSAIAVTAVVPFGQAGGVDVAVNDPSGDFGDSTTQSTATMARSDVTGTVCSAYNDSVHGLNDGGFIGFSRSTDGARSFSDQGAVDPTSDGVPALTWRRTDDAFYLVGLRLGGIGLWRSTDDCVSFELEHMVYLGPGQDRPTILADNSILSPYFGRLYVVVTDYAAGGRISSTHSVDGGATFVEPTHFGQAGAFSEGAWPAITATGVLYVGWMQAAEEMLDILVARSRDGGVSYQAVTSPAAGVAEPFDVDATTWCFRRALNGRVRYLPGPQLAVGPDGVLHAVYSYDPDGTGNGDTVDVFYRRSVDAGATWSDELRLNDDDTLTDQFLPTMSVGPGNVVTTAWYDRRLDPANLLIDYYHRMSFDGGLTWRSSERVSDVSSPVYLDPELARCYHGDFDRQLQSPSHAVLQWADDRKLSAGHPDPDVYVDLAPLSEDFLVLPDPAVVSVCAPVATSVTVDVPQFEAFAETVALSLTGIPDGMEFAFSPDSLTPPGASRLLLTGAPDGGFVTSKIVVVGTSSPSAISHDRPILLRVFGAPPPAPDPVAPADGELDVDVFPTLEWEPSESAAGFVVEVARDASFEDLVVSAESLWHELTLASPLGEDSVFFWRVRGTNDCGAGPASQPRSFHTRTVPALLLVDDDSNAPDTRPFWEAALAALGESYEVWDTENSDEEPSKDQLSVYERIIWWTGTEFGGPTGPGPVAEQALTDWLDLGGRCLLVSSQDYAWARGTTDFMEQRLGVAEADDTGQFIVTGEGTVYGGLGPYTLDYPFVDYSDSFIPTAEAEVAFSGLYGDGAVARIGPNHFTTFLGFPGAPMATADLSETLERFFSACPDPGLLFADGFESGGFGPWTEAVGLGR